MKEIEEQLPDFLQTYGGLLSHFNNHFSNLNSYERGASFAQLVRKLIPHTTTGERFSIPTLNQHSHDKGVDLECLSKDKCEALYIQSKYTIKNIDELDIIFSKFMTFDQELEASLTPKDQPKQFSLLPEEGSSEKVESEVTRNYMIVTTSDIKGLIEKYEKSKRSTLDFYRKLTRSNRVYIIDGPSLVPVLQKTYRKLHVLPSNFELSSTQHFIHIGNVYLGVIPAPEIARLYDEFGDALFLENIREFLGVLGQRNSLTDVNREILESLEKDPENFLAKNNGLTFRAGQVSLISENTLSLRSASIVNGLQTTMSIVEQPSPKSYVSVKIVETEHSWEIAKASNFQNKVDRIDLDLAEYIRPRQIRTSASNAGISFEYLQNKKEDNVFEVLETIYQDRVSYQEIRSLFIGIFSRNPNNIINPDYNQLRTDLIDRIYAEDPRGEKLFSTLFSIQALIQRAAEEVQDIFRGKEYSDLFKRFWEEAKPNYRAFLAILAMCGCVRSNIYQDSGKLDFESISIFLERVTEVVDGSPDVYIRYFRHSFKTVASHLISQGNSKEVTLQNMYRSMHRAQFSPLFLQVCMNADDDDFLRKPQL
ncbi:AIPR family protein [Leptolyngbya sp. KIOST-1]|uniref:AIPR family protein n=1 Tax=Leptolyngbya sp. KIOST-1 TaxID=1229172 RepID=UPI00056D0898|nr:AIPR family protein [Leptolyngbya sp. KIOST-1]